MLDLMTRGAVPNEEDFLDENERRLRENERTRKAPKLKLRKTGADVTESSTTRKGKKGKKSELIPEDSSTGESKRVAASIPGTQETCSTISKTGDPISSTGFPSHNGDGSCTDIAKAKVTPMSSNISPSIEVLKTPPREPEVGQRRGRSEYRSEPGQLNYKLTILISYFVCFPDSPEAQKTTKRSRVNLVAYASSPEKDDQQVASDYNSDIEMFDFRTKADRSGLFESESINSFTPSISTDNRSNDTLPLASDDELQAPALEQRQAGTMLGLSNTLSQSANRLTTNNRGDITEDQRLAQAKKERREMKATLKSKIRDMDAAKPRNEQDKLKQDQLREFKLKKAREQLDVGPSVAGPSSKYSRCLIKVFLFHTYSRSKLLRIFVGQHRFTNRRD